MLITAAGGGAVSSPLDTESRKSSAEVGTSRRDATDLQRQQKQEVKCGPVPFRAELGADAFTSGSFHLTRPTSLAANSCCSWLIGEV